jgi:hypothetical protein
LSFKELKQTHRLADFLGHNSNAVRWKVWIELLPFYLLLRFCVFLSQWDHSFTRLSMLPRSALWQRLEWRSLFERHWDSGRRRPLLGPARTSLFARPDLSRRDSRWSYYR